MSPPRSPSARPAFARAAASPANLRFSPRRRTRNAASAAHEHFPLHLPCLLPSKGRTALGLSTLPLFHFSTSPLFNHSPFPIPRIKTVLLLRKRMNGRREVKIFVSRAGERSCRCGLPRAEGRKGAAARGEGRPTIVTTESLEEVSKRPSSQRVAAPFQGGGTPPGKQAAFRGRAAGAETAHHSHGQAVTYGR